MQYHSKLAEFSTKDVLESLTSEWEELEHACGFLTDKNKSPYVSLRLTSIKGTVHPQMKICRKCTHPQVKLDVDGFIS